MDFKVELIALVYIVLLDHPVFFICPAPLPPSKCLVLTYCCITAIISLSVTVISPKKNALIRIEVICLFQLDFLLLTQFVFYLVGSIKQHH